ncbi:MAG: cyclic nucleotide-binding domain-containing protein [Balneolaceae bacterium]|nr:cyclic nucleotide-binding domain-containing protein [Balneolaceae bacterium]MBO6545834.1 cyclic nucleotide-binding domain-containing protein [Balneolaceae bacterium]MBO6647230.1 cyclic nucleotide-binding domain-containing protein [Balneolaceae bacterium]
MERGFLNNREVILKFIHRAVSESEELRSLVVPFRKGDVLFRQGDSLKYLYLLLKGSVGLKRLNEDESSLNLLKLEPGHFVGIMAFSTGNDSLTTAEALEDSKALKIGQAEFETYLNDNPRLRHPLQQLMMSNMADRFMKNLQLESKMHQLNQKLEEEREQLKEAYQQLENSHQKLVHQEKMATLGELVAGFAHEVNNPASALLRSSEALITNFEMISTDDALSTVFSLGLKSTPMSSTEVRKRMLFVQKRFPWVAERSLVRKLAQMPEEAYEIIESRRKRIPVEKLIQQFEAGKFIHNIQVASERIANLVKSLKSYSRQDSNEAELIDVRDGINDTILVLSNRLKYLDVTLELLDIPKTKGHLGELNQVWTNIIVNACDVLPNGGKLTIKTKEEGDYKIIVEISDNGPGIPEDLINRIFEPNFTTKNQGAKFGLGLGLAISNEIVRQHGGFIRASNKKEGGAKFEIILPVKES